MEQIATMFVFPFSSQQPVKCLFAATSCVALKKLGNHHTTNDDHNGGNGGGNGGGWNVYDVDREIERQSNRPNSNDDSSTSKFMTWFATKIRACRLNEQYVNSVLYMLVVLVVLLEVLIKVYKDMLV